MVNVNVLDVENHQFVKVSQDVRYLNPDVKAVKHLNPDVKAVK